MPIYYSAYFDEARFDYSFFDVIDVDYGTFLTQGDKLIDEEGEEVTLTKVTETLDTEGRTVSTTETSDTSVDVKVQPISERMRNLTGRGISVTGNMLLIAKRSYDLPNNGDGTTIEPGDKITRSSEFGSEVYIVETLVGKQRVSGAECCRKLIIKRLYA